MVTPIDAAAPASWLRKITDETGPDTTAQDHTAPEEGETTIERTQRIRFRTDLMPQRGCETRQ